MLTPPKNPAGELATQANPDRATREREIATIQELPNRLRQLLSGLTDDQLDTKYVNWSIRQIVNHLSDSHMNGFIRLKLALTEDEPTIKPYRQGEFAETAEAATGSLEPTLQLLIGLHDRWVRLLQGLDETAWSRGFLHPESNKRYTLGESLMVYGWHSRHHSAQIEWIKANRL